MIKKLFSTVLLSLLCGGILFSGGVKADINYQITASKGIKTEITHEKCQGCEIINEDDIVYTCHRMNSTNPATFTGEYTIVSYTDSDSTEGRILEVENNEDDDGIICSITIRDIGKNKIIIRNSSKTNNDTNFETTIIPTSGSNDNLQELDFSNCGIRSINGSMLLGLNIHTLRLSNNKINRIAEDTFTKTETEKNLTNVYLDNNQLTSISDKIVECKKKAENGIKTITFNFENNQIESIGNSAFSQYPQNPRDNRCSINLKNNNLTEIPNIFNGMGNRKIILNNKTIGDGNDIDLRYNPITFLKITEPTDSYIYTCSQNFKRDGYNYANASTSYSYTLSNGSGEIVESGTGGNNTITVSPLKDGEYTLTVNLLSGGSEIIKTEQKTFTNTLYYSLNITNPTNGQILKENDITFQWQGDYTCGYYYKINLENGNGTKLIENQSVDTGSYNYPPNYHYTGLSDGKYKFTVDMYDYNDEIIHSGSVNFTVSTAPEIPDDKDSKVTITAPSSSQTITTSSTTFSWSGQVSSGYSIDGYRWDLYEGNNTNSTPISGGNISSSTSSLLYNGLTNGTYTLKVTMNYSATNGTTNTISTGDTKTFTVNTTPPDTNSSLTINTGNITTKSYKFTRSGQISSGYTISGYDYKLKKGNTETEVSGCVGSTTYTHFTCDKIANGKYTLEVIMHYHENGQTKDIKITKTQDFNATLSYDDAEVTITKPTNTTLTGKNQEFTRSGSAGVNYTVSGYYYKLINTGTNEILFQGTGNSSLKSFTGNNLTNGNYKLTVTMYIKDSANNVKTKTKEKLYIVDLDSSDVKLEITNPKTDGSKIDSKSATLTRSGTAGNNYAISGYYYKLENTDKNEIVIQNSGNVTSFSKSDFSNGNYKLTVTMYYKDGSSNIKEKTEIRTFTVSIKSSGGGGGSSGGGRRTNNLSIKINDSNPTTNQRVGATITIDDNYRGKVTFTKIQYRDSSADKWVDAPLTSSNYVSDSSDDAKLGYYNITSSDNGKKVLSDFLKFKKNGNYRIYVEDKDGYTDYVQFYIGNGKVEPVPTPASDEERYIARSCKKYKLTYNNSLNVRTSPNLKKTEYFVTTDYFKRYIDSKNAQIDGCPTNDPRISTTYKDTTNRDDKYTAPNGKVYFINNKNGKYQSDELDYPSMLFSTLSEIKYYIRDRNPFINMAWTK